MADPKDMQDNDGVENPRMVGDSADQMYDDDTMNDSDDPSFSRQERIGGSGGLGGGMNQIAGRE